MKSPERIQTELSQIQHQIQHQKEFYEMKRLNNGWDRDRDMILEAQIDIELAKERLLLWVLEKE